MVNWNKLGFVLASEYRKKILLVLKSFPKTPKEISDETGINLSHVSLTVSKLIDIKIIECLTPELKRGKLFAVTDEGNKIIEMIEKRKE